MFKHFLIRKSTENKNTPGDAEEMKERTMIGQVSTKHKTKSMKECEEEDVEKASAAMNVMGHEGKQPGTKPREDGEKAFEPSFKRKFKKAVTAGSSQNSGSNMMHTVADGTTPSVGPQGAGDVNKGTPEMMAEHFKKHPEDRDQFHGEERKKKLHKSVCPVIKGLNSLVKSIAKSHEGKPWSQKPSQEGVGNAVHEHRDKESNERRKRLTTNNPGFRRMFSGGN